MNYKTTEPIPSKEEHASSGHAHPVRTNGDMLPPATRSEQIKATAVSVGVVVVLLVVLGFVLGVKVPGMASSPPEEKPHEPPAPLGADLFKGHPHTLTLSEIVRVNLGIRQGNKEKIATAVIPTDKTSLVLHGATLFDPAHLMRIRARFAPAEVVKIGQHACSPVETKSGRSEFRELRPGDRVQKGEILGVFFSVDVGNKKRDLLDALVQLKLDQKILDRVEEKRNDVPEVFRLNALRAVQGDRNAINRALHTLLLWNIPQDEIDDLQVEAKLISEDQKRWELTTEGQFAKGEKIGTNFKYDPEKESENPWGKVILRAPDDGVIVERNVTKNEIVQDPTTCLFQIAKIEKLLVIANAPEDELPNLNALKLGDRQWTVSTVGAASASGLKGQIEEIGYMIDPNQHTAIIKGFIDNPKGLIRAGQFVSATVEIAPPEDVVEIPIDCVVEDGSYAVVFVQTDPTKYNYTMKRVELTRRMDKKAYVRSKPFTKEEQLTREEEDLGFLPKEPLCQGERLVMSGAGELKIALLELESRPAKETSEKDHLQARKDK